jgi:hypothetical protein
MAAPLGNVSMNYDWALRRAHVAGVGVQQQNETGIPPLFQQSPNERGKSPQANPISVSSFSLAQSISLHVAAGYDESSFRAS